MLGIPTRLFRTLSVTIVLVGIVISIAYARLLNGPATNSQTSTDRLEVELITLRSSGFEPAELARSKGPFVLFVDDRSGRDGSSLTLQRVRGEHLRDVNTSRMKSEWHGVINLPPGDYVLTDTASPERNCQIRILN